MPGRLNARSGKRKYLYGAILLMFVSLICVAFSMTGSDDYDAARREIILRKIGHEILLQSGDSTSRVLPVNKIGKNEFQISFDNAFTFEPGSLVGTTQRLLAKDPLARDYVVNVLNCGTASVAYGYAMSQNKKDDIVTCLGRKQPSACYLINIKFKPAGMVTAKNGFLLGSLPLLAFVGLIFYRSVKPRKTLNNPPGLNVPAESPEVTDSPVTQNHVVFMLGSIQFDMTNQALVVNGNSTDLTGTEARILHIFALSPNEVIERSRLQKEIWEDEGVIVGRSLDVFISKLRKKLEPDPNTSITVVRGKGYKLEINV